MPATTLRIALHIEIATMVLKRFERRKPVAPGAIRKLMINSIPVIFKAETMHKDNAINRE